MPWKRSKTGPAVDTGDTSVAVAGDPQWQSDVDRGLREFRLEGAAGNPMFPASLAVAVASPGYLAVRVVVGDPDEPNAPPFDAMYEFSLNQYGGLNVRDPLNPFGVRTLATGAWEIPTGIPHCEEAPFMWCIRREGAGGAGNPPALALFVRWLTGHWAWRD